MSQEKYCDEAPELIDLCERCINPDCTSDDGCRTYQALKRKIAKRDKQKAPKAADKPLRRPAMELEVQPAKMAMGTQESLLKCNRAIEALEALYNDDGGSMIFDTEMIGELLQSLKEARVREYGMMIDWNAIAERMKKDG